MEAGLAEGDVDAVRRLLRGAAGDEAHSRPPKPLVNSSSTLFGGTLTLKVQIGGQAVLVANSRTMGKVVWPAGHAAAEALAGGGARRSATGSRAVLVEVGAGAALPSLVAAAEASPFCWDRVLATDFTEEGVQLIEHNCRLNGRCSRLSISRLDVVSDPAALSRLLEPVEAALAAEARAGKRAVAEVARHDVCVLACDMSYDPDAVLRLFDSASRLRTREWRPIVAFWRSDNFEHLDDYTVRTAGACGFELRDRRACRAAGVLDGVTRELHTPCAEEAVTLLLFARKGEEEGLALLVPRPRQRVAERGGAADDGDEWAVPQLRTSQM